jgi:hypothetical protein
MQGSSIETLSVTNKLKAAKDAATDVSKAYVDGQTGMILYTDAQKQQGDQVKKVTDFLNSNKDAIQAQITADKAGTDASKEFGDQQAQTASQLQLTASQFGVTTQAIKDAHNAYHDTNDEAGNSLAVLQAVGDKYGDTAISVQGLINSQVTAQGSFSATTLKMQEENDAAGLLKQALDLLNGGSLNLMEAQTNVAKSASTAASSLAKNGDTIDQVDKKTGQFTDAALANQAALQAAASSAQNHAEAVARATGSTEAGTAALAADKTAMENSLRSQGLLTDAVQDYINKLYAVPPVVHTKAELDAEKAKADAAILAQEINSLHDRTIHLTTVNSSVGTMGGMDAAGVGNNTGAVAFALGGRVRYLAGGGIGDPLAHGTDTVRAMLTPDEQVINRASSNQIRRDYPGAFEYMNATGKLPPTGGGMGPVYLTAYFQNPITGDEVQATVRAVARDEVGGALREMTLRRPRG